MALILDMLEAKKMLADEGFPVVPSRAVKTWEETKGEADRLSYPVVLKLVSRRYSHKSDIGGVKVGISSEETLKEAFSELDHLRKHLDPEAQIVIEPMAPKGVEFFAGFIRDAQFGPVLSFGLGGIFVELFEEVNFLLLPASERDILSMCRKMKGWEKLKRGFRHLPPVEEKMVVQFLNRFSKWAYEKPSFKEIDLNPIVATQDEVLVVDARIVILNEI